MSRHSGPRLTVLCVLGVELPALSRNVLGEHCDPPAHHGWKPECRAGFGVQLIEKQKPRSSDGPSERPGSIVCGRDAARLRLVRVAAVSAHLRVKGVPALPCERVAGVLSLE